MDTTVAELLELAMPAGTRVVGGRAGLDRTVDWALLLRAADLGTDEIEEHQLAILAASTLDLPAEALPKLIDELAQRQAAGLAVIDEAPDHAVAQADRLALPLLVLPASARPHEVERAIIATAVQRQARLEQRGLEIAQQLTQAVTAGRGFTGILDDLADLTGAAAVLLDELLVVRAIADTGYILPPRNELQTLLRDTLLARPELVQASRTTVEEARLGEHDALWTLIAPVVLNDATTGYLWLVTTERPRPIEELAVRRAADVCVIESARQQSVAEAESRLHGDFIEALLSGRFPSHDAILVQARNLGYAIEPPYIALVFQFHASEGDFDEQHFQRARRWLDKAVNQELLRYGPRAITWVRDDRVIAFCPVGNGRDLAPVRQLADRICERAVAWLDGSVVSVGIGRLQPGIAGIQETYREAEQAVQVGVRLFGTGRVSYFGDLGVYRLLFHLQDSGELTAFYDETIARLVDYDARHSAELVRTLDAFFTHLGNLTRIAEALYVHRNTLTYRLQRIEEITGLSLNDPEDRLSLQLALKVKEIMPAATTPPSFAGKLHKSDRLFFSKDRLEP